MNETKIKTKTVASWQARSPRVTGECPCQIGKIFHASSIFACMYNLKLYSTLTPYENALKCNISCQKFIQPNPLNAFDITSPWNEILATCLQLTCRMNQCKWKINETSRLKQKTINTRNLKKTTLKSVRRLNASSRRFSTWPRYRSTCSPNKVIFAVSKLYNWRC